MRITPDRMLGVLGAAAKPAKVCQEQFDYCEEVLVRLARTDWDKVDEGDFSYYFLDLAHSDLQPDLFRHVFPACLKYWYDTLMRDAYAGRFHYALVQDQILEEMLSPRERESLLEFFRDGFLDRIEKERDFARDRLDLPLQRTRLGSAGDSTHLGVLVDARSSGQSRQCRDVCVRAGVPARRKSHIRRVDRRPRTLRPLSGLHFWQSLAERQPNVLADHAVGALHPRKAGTSGGGSSG
jgi:hypothetical protein